MQSDFNFLDLVSAVKLGHTGFAAAIKTEPSERLTKLKNLPNLLISSRSDLLAVLASESGASSIENFDFDQSIETVKAILEHNEKLIESDLNSSQSPVGLVGIITGSKNPFTHVLSRLTCALAMGNAVIWKPSEKLPETSRAIANLFSQLNLSEGLLNKVEGNYQAAEAILQHPAIHYILFSGASETGKRVYSLAAESGKKVQLSMGSRNPAIVFADIDLTSQMPHIVRTLYDYHGLGRWRASRLFVQEGIYKQFMSELRAYLASTSLPYLGRMAVESENSNFSKAYDQAIHEKGKELFESNSPAKFVFDLTNCSTLQQEEIHGPLVTAASFKYQFDAIKYANTSPLGKAAYVWSADTDKAVKAARKLEVGKVFINQLPKTLVFDRYSASKESGFGAEGILDLLEFCSHQTSIQI